MIKHNANNERMKRQYCIFLKEAKRQNEASIDAVSKAMSRFEEYTKWRDFNTFHHQQAIGFKAHFTKQENVQTGKPLSKATLHSTFRHLKGFFQWLAMQPRYKSRINYSETEYFSLSKKDTRIATAKRQKPVPTMEQINHVLSSIPASTDIERRNRALVAFTLLTGARDSAIASLKLKHVDLAAGSVFQDARDVNTKFSKTFTTIFFPVGDTALQIVTEWIEYLKSDLLFGNDDPLFPSTKVVNGANKTFESSGLTNDHWRTTTPIRKIFESAFMIAGLPYFNPHSFRSTLVRLGETLCQSPEEFKAWSQNMGHEGVLTTFCSYGEVQQHRQAELIKKLKTPRLIINTEMQSVIKAAIQTTIQTMQNQQSG